MNKTTMTLIDNFIRAAASYEAAMEKLRTAYNGDKLSPADLRLALAMALVHHHPSKYRGQLDRETGKPVRDSALSRQVKRYAATIMGTTKVKPSEEITIPRALQSGVNALLHTYSVAQLRAAIKVAEAKAKAKAAK